jgi:agmatinase
MTQSSPRPVFMGASRARTAQGFDAAIFGAPHGTPYKSIDNKVHASAADAFRKALAADAEWLTHWDFDFGGTLLDDDAARIADLGDLATRPLAGKANRALIEATTRKIIEAGAVPIMFGGDDSTPIPFIAGFAANSPIVILQIDAHIDWRDERYGERFGFSSTMRRASELDHVWRIVQAGVRGLGSAREQEVTDAKTWGARIFTSRHIHHNGVDEGLGQRARAGGDRRQDLGRAHLYVTAYPS